MSVAIITGASSGLGREYFKSVRELCPEVDEIWLIARRKERLEEIAEENPDILVAPISLDLSREHSFDILAKVLEARSSEVEILINNAGFGILSEVENMAPHDISSMIDLNVKGLTLMTGTVLPYMISGGKIINVSSIASFCPNAGLTVYSSTKAYVTSFSRGLAEELKKQGTEISVTAVCPGPMDTEFNAVAGIDANTSPRFVALPKQTPEKIARNSLRAAINGRQVYSGGLYKFYRVLCKIIPHRLMMKLAKVL
ncbi:MAG: SDR family NAD(P)-dependent oxidoreductase [Clostridia bacterium]|nr:SDR family NAD(P)-dependent oxidoreductase [Clostridia bacterium]